MTRAQTHGGWRHLPATLIAVGFVLPIVYMVTGSLRTPGTASAAVLTMFAATAGIVLVQYLVVRRWQRAFA